MRLSHHGIDAGPLRRAAHWHASEYAFWLLPIAAYFAFQDNLLFMSQIAITALFALSLDLILGYAGIVSLGHAAYFGCGAYAAGYLAQQGHGDPLLGLMVAAAVAATVGFATSFLVLRGTDLTRLLVTLGVGLMFYEAANKLTEFTGGVDGMQGVEMQPLLGRFGFDLYGRVGYVYSVAVLFVLFWIARRLAHSPFGMSLRGVRLNAARMPALGTPVRTRLIAVYTIAAAYAGVAGALLAQTTQFVALDVLSFNRSAELMLIVVLGGAGRLYGAVLGAIVFMVAHHFLADLHPEYWQFWLGALLVVIVLFARGGLMGGIDKLRRMVARRDAREPA